jgi:hypothetical protein
MSKFIDVYSYLSLEEEERKNMRKNKERLTPSHFVNCFYVKPMRINVLALNVRQVTRHYKVQTWEVSKTVCTIGMLNDDLLGTGVKAFANSHKTNYNKVKELHYETT